MSNMAKVQDPMINIETLDHIGANKDNIEVLILTKGIDAHLHIDHHHQVQTTNIEKNILEMDVVILMKIIIGGKMNIENREIIIEDIQDQNHIKSKNIIDALQIEEILQNVALIKMVHMNHIIKMSPILIQGMIKFLYINKNNPKEMIIKEMLVLIKKIFREEEDILDNLQDKEIDPIEKNNLLQNFMIDMKLDLELGQVKNIKKIIIIGKVLLLTIKKTVLMIDMTVILTRKIIENMILEDKIVTELKTQIDMKNMIVEIKEEMNIKVVIIIKKAQITNRSHIKNGMHLII